MPDNNWTIESKDDGGYIVKDSYGGIVNVFLNEDGLLAAYLQAAIQLRDIRVKEARQPMPSKFQGNSMDNYEPGKCSQCGKAIKDHGPPYGFCGVVCKSRWDAARPKCQVCGGYDCPMPFCKTITERDEL